MPRHRKPHLHTNNYWSSFSCAGDCWCWWIIDDMKMKTWLIIDDNYDHVLKIVSKFWIIRILILSHVALIIFRNSKQMFGGLFDPNLAGAEQDRFGLMTLLRLIGRLAHEGVSDTVPERVTFHCACGRQDRVRSSWGPIRSNGWQQNDSRWRITLSEVQISSSVCGSCCKTVTQSWFTCPRLTHTHTHTPHVTPPLFTAE